MIDLTPFIIGGAIGFCLAGLAYAAFHKRSEQHWVTLLRDLQRENRKYKALYELHRQTEERQK